MTVAAVQGHAIGGGFQLALACDLRMVADDVQFCMAEPRSGIVPDLGGTYPLVRAVGLRASRGDLPDRRRIGRRRGGRVGLALRAVPRAELDAAVDELVAACSRAPAGAATETLALLAGVADGLDPAAALAAERAAQIRRLRVARRRHRLTPPPGVALGDSVDRRTDRARDECNGEARGGGWTAWAMMRGVARGWTRRAR